MSEIIRVCRIHGDLTIEQTKKSGKQLSCKQCHNEWNRKQYHKTLTSDEIDEKLRFKICKIHGQLTRENTIIYGARIQCHACNLAQQKKNYDKHKNKYAETFAITRREKVNSALKQKRLENLEEYRKYGRDKYHRNREKETIRTIARKRGVSYDELVALYEKQQNRCAICGEMETRKSPTSNETTLLCYDHNHENKNNRELLCHACNQVVGFSKEDPVVLIHTMKYLIKHENLKPLKWYFENYS